MSGPLSNAQHEKFAQEIAKGSSQIDAYIAAGYKPNESHASRLVSNGKVAARIAEIVGKAAAAAEITAERVLRELALIGFANMGDYMRVGHDGDPVLDFSNLTRDQTAALVEVTVDDYTDGRGDDARDVKRVKFKLADKRAALVDLGKHLKLFTDKVEHSGSGGGPIEVITSAMTAKEAAERYRNELG